MSFNCIKSRVLTALFASFFLVFPASAAFPESSTRTVIILPFVNDGSANIWIAAGIYDYLERSIKSSGVVSVIPSSEVSRISKYIGVIPGTPLSPEIISRMTLLSGADEAVSVRYFVTGENLTISVEIIKGKDSVVRKSFSYSESVSRIYDIQDSIFRGITSDEIPVIQPLKPYKVKSKGKMVWVQPKTPWLEPYEWYARGAELADKSPDTALSYFVKVLKNDPENTSALIAASKIVHDRQGSIDGALGYLLRADKIFVRRGESSTVKYAYLMIQIADIYEHKNDHMRSQIFVNRALYVWKKRKDFFRDAYASFLTDTGRLYTETGNFLSGADYFSMAKEVCQKSGQGKDLRNAWISLLMGETYFSLQNPQTAEECYLNAEKIFEELGLSGTSDFAEIRLKKARALFSLGKVKDASDAYNDAQKMFSVLGINDKAKQASLERHEMTRPLKKNSRN